METNIGYYLKYIYIYIDIMTIYRLNGLYGDQT